VLEFDTLSQERYRVAGTDRAVGIVEVARRAYADIPTGVRPKMYGPAALRN
jgi:hypothetical protein